MATPASSSRRFLAPGDQFGKHAVIRQIAVGGTAELYLTRAMGIEGVEIVNMVLNEARRAATLRQPNMAQVYDIGQDSSECFFSMEYVHGEDRGRLVATGREHGVPISLDGALTIAAGLCAGLHDAHEKAAPDGKLLGVVHRDASPANVLVSYDGAVKLVGFGIARAGRPSALSQMRRPPSQPPPAGEGAEGAAADGAMSAEVEPLGRTLPGSREPSGGRQPLQPVMAVGQPGRRRSQPVMAVGQSHMSGGEPGRRPLQLAMAGGESSMSGGDLGRRPLQPAMAGGESSMSGGDLGGRRSQPAMAGVQSHMSGGEPGRRPSQLAMVGGDPGRRPSQSAMVGGDPGRWPSQPVMAGVQACRRRSQPVMAGVQSHMSGGEPGRRPLQLQLAMVGGDPGRRPSQSAMVGGNPGRRPSQPAMAGRVEYVEW